jgi:High potential iron-sulfur protein
MPRKIRKKVTKQSVHYHIVPATAQHRCANCAMFHKDANGGECDLVEGTILAQAWCKEWRKK